MSEVALTIENVTKRFPGVIALDNVSLELKKGQIYGLIGENGAGKSTLINILAGTLKPSEGDVYINGQKHIFKNVHESRENGISIVFQEIALIDEMSVAENLFIGEMPTNSLGKINWKKAYQESVDVLGELGEDIDPKRKISELSVAEKQIVEICRAIRLDANIVVFDEATSTLTKRDIDMFFKLMRQLKDKGVTQVFVSHRMDELFEICDYVSVLRDGEHIATKPIDQWTRESLIEKMVGRALSAEFPERDYETIQDETVLLVENLCTKGFIEDVSFSLRKGEILGFAGLVGAGRTEIVRALFGADAMLRGSITVKGKKVTKMNPRKAIRHGLSLLTENRKEEGLNLASSIIENITATKLGKVSQNGILQSQKETETANGFIKMLRIKTPSEQQVAVNLSGGNQQKVVLAKWLFSDTEILFLDEPTRGIDVGAKKEIYDLMNDLTAKGKSIIMISSELPEVLAMSDRIAVMCDGKLKKILNKSEATQEIIMHYAMPEMEVSPCN